MTYTDIGKILLLSLIPIGIVGVVVYLVVSSRPEAPNMRVIETQFMQYRAAADVHYGRYLEYRGMCTDLSLPPEVICQGGEDAYRLHIRLTDGTFYCTDSTKFAGVVTREPTDRVCPR